MVVQRSDSRRRRVVVDPTLQAGETAPLPEAIAKKSSRAFCPYASGANRRHQKKTTDFIPKRIRSVSLVFAILLTVIGALNLLSLYAGGWSSRIGSAGAATLSLAGRGTLAGWFSSFLLIISGLASLQIYALRQHRRDDYRGSYRIWLWMAMLLLLGSVNCVVDLTTIGSRLFQSLTAVAMTGDSWWPLAIKFCLLSMLVARGVFEVRESRGSLALVLFVWVAYSAAAVMQLPKFEPAITQLARETVLGNCFLFATVALLFAEIIFARFIFLQAHGLIKPATKKIKQPKSKSQPVARRKKPSRKNSNTNTDVPSEATIHAVDEKESASRISTRIATSKSTGKTAKPAALQSKADKRASDTGKPRAVDHRDDNDEGEGILKMSKSEIRRQRKQVKPQRRAA